MENEITNIEPAYSDVTGVLNFLSESFKDTNELAASYAQLPDEQRRQAVLTFKAFHIADLPNILDKYQKDGGYIPDNVIHDVEVIAKQAEAAMEKGDLESIDSMLQTRDYREYNELIGNYLDLLSKQCQPRSG